MTAAGAIVGVDVGGTTVRVGVVEGGAVLRVVTSPSRLASTASTSTVGLLVDLVRVVCAGNAIRAVGIAASGPVDTARGMIDNPYTLPDWSGFLLRDELADALGVPVVMENDAAAAAWAEYCHGAGRGADPMAMVTLGTGVGTALVYQGELYRGHRGFHPESGHHLLDPAGPICYCGQNGCWEVLASGTAYTQALAVGAAEDEVVEAIGRHVGLGLVNVYSFWAPEVVVIGGGLAALLPRMLPAIHAVIDRSGPMLPPTGTVLRPAAIEEPGVVGAAALARRAGPFEPAQP